MQGLDVAVFVIGGYILTETVGVRIDAGCLTVSGGQHSVNPVVGELIAADRTLVACLPGHAADAAVVLDSTGASVVIQILGELRSTDARQPAADIVSVRLLVHGRTVQRLALQAAQIVISVGSKRYLTRTVNLMLQE